MGTTMTKNALTRRQVVPIFELKHRGGTEVILRPSTLWYILAVLVALALGTRALSAQEILEFIGRWR
jgi:hypothetical protein